MRLIVNERYDAAAQQRAELALARVRLKAAKAREAVARQEKLEKRGA